MKISGSRNMAHTYNTAQIKVNQFHVLKPCMTVQDLMNVKTFGQPEWKLVISSVTLKPVCK